MKLTILGCGASSGVPVIGCTCEVCSSSHPYNKRLRTSALVTNESTNILIDSGPDLRQQALVNGINKINGLIYTHAHADHINGADDVQRFKTPYNSDNCIPIYSDQYTMDILQNRVPYLFNEISTVAPWRKSFLSKNTIEYYQSFNISTVSILPFPQKHGNMISLGLIFNNKIAYCTDVKELPQEAYSLLENIELLVLGCLGYRETVAHAHLELILEWLDKIKPKSVILTHMSHEIEYNTINKKLADYIKQKKLSTKIMAAYDGYSINI